jgi:hypothetical protein
MSQGKSMTVAFDFTSPRDVREQRARQLAGGPDPAAAARVLGLCPGLSPEKAALAERIIARDPASADLLPLIRHLDAARLARLAADSIRLPDRRSLVLEIARHCPVVVRPHVEQLQDDRVLAAARAEAPDNWIAPLLDAYTKTRDVRHVRALGQLRTDAALECLIDTSKTAPGDQLPAFALAIENAGVFPQGRNASVYFDAFRAFVVSRGESPHHMGPGYPFAVPLCPFCNTPAERLVTLDAQHLESYALEASPTFFWYRCACDNGEHILVKHTDQGLEGVMTAMTSGPVSSPLPAASLLLEPFPRASIVGGPARPGAGEHQIGGYPVWIHETFFPRVPGTKLGMRFIGSIDLATIPLRGTGIVYCFFDDTSRIAVSLRQTP